jgi:ADP-ribose pyrophosphatase YjhB (NUDIX family)
MNDPRDESAEATAEAAAAAALMAALGRGPDGRSTGIASGRGAPAWLAETVRHCVRCGGSLREGPVSGDDRERLVCQSCDHIFYINPRLVVTTFPRTDAGGIVLIRRGIEPGRGLWAQPGGFLEVDETVTEAIIRETHEETGLVVEPGPFIGLYARLEAAVIVLAVESRIVGGSMHPTPEALEVAAFAPADIPWPDVAFETTRWALRDLLGMTGSHRSE